MMEYVYHEAYRLGWSVKLWKKVIRMKSVVTMRLGD